MAEKVPVYEGSSPYIFISYAHKDSESVLRVLDVLHSRGYRLWYDDGIAPGSEWPEYIATHLDQAEAVISFISDNSVNSSNCRREITFALSRNKPFISVFLERTELPLGLELQISAQQSVLRYNYDTERAFWDKLCSTPALEPCKDQLAVRAPEKVVTVAPEPVRHAIPEQAAAALPDTVPEPASVALPDTVSEPVSAALPDKVNKPTNFVGGKPFREPPIVVIPGPDPSTTTEPAPGTLMEPEPVTVTEPAPAADATPDKAVEKTKKKANKLIGVIAIIAVLIVTAVVYGIGRGQLSSSQSVYYELSDENVTKETIASINRMRNLYRVCFRNCTFDEGVLADLDPKFDSAPAFDFRDCTGVDDLSFLSNYESINTLTIRNCGLTDDVVPDLSGTQVDFLNFSGNPELTHLSLNSEELSEVDLSDTQVENIDFLAGAEELRILNLKNTNVSDLSPIAQLERITTLILSGSKVNSFTTELGCLGLTELYLNGCGLTSPDGLQDYVALKKLDLGNNSLTDVSFIAQIAPNLEMLDLSGNDITGSDLAFLKNANNMVQLGLESIDLSECQLSYLENMPNLNTLLARNCNLTDISGLSNCSQLILILLGYNEISDISPLASLIEKKYDNRILEMTNNQVGSFSPLNAYYETIIMTGNPVSESNNGELFQVETCMTDYFDGIENSSLAANAWDKLYISNCPRDKQLEVSQKARNAVFCTRAEQLEALKTMYPGLGFDEYEEAFLAE